MCFVSVEEYEAIKAENEKLKYKIYGDDYSDGLKDQLAEAEKELKKYSTERNGSRRDVWEVDHNEWVANTFETLMEKIGMEGSVANDACDFIEKKLEQQDQDLHICNKEMCDNKMNEWAFVDGLFKLLNPNAGCQISPRNTIEQAREIILAILSSKSI